MSDIIKRYGAIKHYGALIMLAGVMGGVFCYHAPASAEDSDSVFPLFREMAEGYDLPEPYGAGLNHMRIRQGIAVDSIRFTGLSMGKLPLDNLISVTAGNTRQKSHTETLRLDAWVLPFMNVYGLAGRTKGHSVSDVKVSVPAFTGGAFPSAPVQTMPFRLDFKGTTYGAGATLAGGVNDSFASLDMNYTQTRFDVLDGHINAFTFTPRVGYRFTTPGNTALHLPQGKLSLWVGSMYQDIQQTFRGQLADLSMPSPALQQWLSRLNKNGNARFEVTQHLTTPWNMLAGVRYDVTPDFNLTAEAGFGGRDSIFLSGEYRF